MNTVSSSSSSSPKLRTWIENHPAWLKVLASPHPALNTIVAILVGTWMLRTQLSDQAFHDSTSLLSFVFALLVGCLYWSFIEYAIHRWIYHGRHQNAAWKYFIDSFHIYHHRNLEDPRVLTAGPLMMLPIGVLLVGPLLILDLDFATAVALGFLGAYAFYEWVHFGIHRFAHPERDRAYLRYIRRFHMYHHDRAWNKNFGNTSELWDRIFGTYEKPENSSPH
jgi:sterol desaturase/sphingolipid hydroxylase (fatty acid hydroxylase superfamily)